MAATATPMGASQQPTPMNYRRAVMGHSNPRTSNPRTNNPRNSNTPQSNNNPRANNPRRNHFRAGRFDIPTQKKTTANYPLTLKLPCNNWVDPNEQRGMPKYHQLMRYLETAGVNVANIKTLYEVTYHKQYLVEFTHKADMLIAMSKTISMNNLAVQFQHINATTVQRKIEGIQAITTNTQITEAINSIPNCTCKNINRHMIQEGYITQDGRTIRPYTGRVVV